MTHTQLLSLKPTTIADTATILAYIHKLAAHEQATHLVEADEATLAHALFVEQAAQAFLVDYKDECVGLVVVSKTFSTYLGKVTLFLEDLYLDEHVRGLGLGKAIFTQLQAFADAHHYGRIEWTCLTSNTSSLAFYEKLGGKPMADKILFRLSVGD